MKKLTKQNLDELAATMNVVPTDEQCGYLGQYSIAMTVSGDVKFICAKAMGPK